MNKAQPLSLFVLVGVEEDCFVPFETILKPLDVALAWFKDFRDLSLRMSNLKPAAVFFDTDTDHENLDQKLEKLKSYFPDSELIGLSSQNSAQFAQKTMSFGFSEFLLKPVAPSEFRYAVEKIQQKRDLLSNWKAPVSRALLQILTCQSPFVLDIVTASSLRTLFSAEGAMAYTLQDDAVCRAKVPPFSKTPFSAKKLCRWNLSGKRKFYSHKKQIRFALFPCQSPSEIGYVVWGIPKKMHLRQFRKAEFLIQASRLTRQTLNQLTSVREEGFLDSLTGLYNARYLKFSMASACQKLKKDKESFALLFIDVDQLKRVNDTFGHLVGTALLIALAKTIKNSVRGIDLVFRYGGDEFVVLLKGASLETALQIAQRIRTQVASRAFRIGSHQVQTSLSIGISQSPRHGTDAETLLKLADTAMYEAKRKKGSRAEIAELQPPEPTPSA